MTPAVTSGSKTLVVWEKFSVFLSPVYICSLSGETISERDKCGQCRGAKVVQDRKLLEVHIEKGMQHNQKITFVGEADESVRNCSGD